MPSSYVSKELDFTNLHLRGRDDEIAQLQDAYIEETVRRSTSSFAGRAARIVWLYGYSGVGKSTLVEHAFSQMPHFCSGKYDQVRSVQPFSALATLMTKLCYILEFEYPPIHLSLDDASVLAKIIPEVRDVIDGYIGHTSDGSQANVNEKADFSSKSEWKIPKLKQAFRNFIKQICQVLTSPLILFLDDLQWADVDSLEIFKSILQLDTLGGGGAGILFVGAYRDNEIDNRHPLTSYIEELEADDVLRIPVSNLDRKSTAQVVADLTHMELIDSKELSDLLYTKTHGNCFFTLLMLQHIQRKDGSCNDLLYVSQSSGRWKWNAEKIRLEMDSSDNVVEFMAIKLRSLPKNTIEVLKLAACLGARIDLDLLEAICNIFFRSAETINCGTQTSFDLSNSLQEAVNEHFIDLNAESKYFKFANDRIQAAVYELINTEESRRTIHSRIGRALLCGMDVSHLTTINLTENNFRLRRFLLAVEQLNRGSDLIEDDTTQKRELALLNLLAAEHAIQTNAYKLSASYLKTAIELLGMWRWEAEYSLSLQIMSTLASVLFSNGETNSCLRVVEEIYSHAECREDKQEAQFLHVEVLACMSRLTECVDVALKFLGELGNRKIPENPGMPCIIYNFVRVQKLCRGKTDEELLNLPLCQDNKILATMRYLASLFPVSYLANREKLTPVLALRMVEISLTHGVGPFAPLAFASFGMVFAARGNFSEAFRFAKLALRFMSERFSEDMGTVVFIHGLLHHVRKPLLDSVDQTLRAYHLCIAKGDINIAAQACTHDCRIRFAAGLRLGNIARDVNAFYSQLKWYNQVQRSNTLLVVQRTILELMDRSNDMPKLMGNVLTDQQFEDYLERSNADKLLFFFGMYSMQSRFLLGNLESAVKYGEKSWKSKGSLQSIFVFSGPYYLFSSLVALDQWKITRKRNYWKIVRRFHKQLKEWSDKGNPNLIHLLALLDAEVLVAQNAKSDVIKSAYEKAIMIATRGDFIHDTALAHERAGQYFLELKADRFWASSHRHEALDHLRTAKELYVSWGAIAKVAQMEKRYGRLVCEELTDILSYGDSDLASRSIDASRKSLRNKAGILSSIT